MSGGTKAVTQTQKQQMAVMMGGMILVLNMLPEQIGLFDAMTIAGKLGKMNLINFEFDLDYNFWTALFLFLSYFGQSQSLFNW